MSHLGNASDGETARVNVSVVCTCKSKRVSMVGPRLVFWYRRAMKLAAHCRLPLWRRQLLQRLCSRPNVACQRPGCCWRWHRLQNRQARGSGAALHCCSTCPLCPGAVCAAIVVKDQCGYSIICRHMLASSARMICNPGSVMEQPSTSSEYCMCRSSSPRALAVQRH